MRRVYNAVTFDTNSYRALARLFDTRSALIPSILLLQLACTEPTSVTIPTALDTPIVFTQLSDTGWDLFAVRMDATNFVRLTSDPADDLYPQWTDAHRRIAFESSRDGGGVFAMRPDGTSVELLYRNVSSFSSTYRFALSPDGAEIAFTPLGSNEVRVANVGPDSTSRLVAFGNQVAWSPGGDKLAFTSPRGIDVVNVDGSGLRTLVRMDGAREPAWSADGGRVAYSQLVPPDGIFIFVAAADGSNPRQVTFPEATSFANDLGVAWSPDGRFLAFQREHLCGPGPSCYDVMIVPTSGGQTINLTASLGIVGTSGRPSW